MHIDREDWERFKAQQDAAEAEIERLTALNTEIISIVLEDKEGDLDFVQFKIRELLKATP